MISILFSFLLYLSVAVAIMQGWLLAALILVVVFSLRLGAAPLIPLAILIDGYFGNFYSLPLLSFLSVWWYLLVLYFRPKIVNSLTTENYESLA